MCCICIKVLVVALKSYLVCDVMSRTILALRSLGARVTTQINRITLYLVLLSRLLAFLILHSALSPTT